MIEAQENSPVTLGRRVKAVGSTIIRNRFARRDVMNTVIGAVAMPILPPLTEYLNNSPVRLDEGLSIIFAISGGLIGLIARTARMQMKEDAIVNQGPGDWGTYKFDDSRTVVGYATDAFKSGQAQLPKPYDVVVDNH